MDKLLIFSEREKKQISKFTEQRKRDIYLFAYGKQFDSEGRRHFPLPIDIAVRVAIRKFNK